MKLQHYSKRVIDEHLIARRYFYLFIRCKRNTIAYSILLILSFTARYVEVIPAILLSWYYTQVVTLFSTGESIYPLFIRNSLYIISSPQRLSKANWEENGNHWDSRISPRESANGKDQPLVPLSISNFERNIGQKGNVMGFQRNVYVRAYFFRVESRIANGMREKWAGNDDAGTNPAGLQWFVN